MNKLTMFWKGLNTMEKIAFGGGMSGGLVGWGIAVNESSKAVDPLTNAIIFVPLYTCTGIVCGTIFPPAVPTYGIIKGLQFMRTRPFRNANHDW